EDAHALALAAHRQRIDGANAGDHGLGDVLAIHRTSAGLIKPVARLRLDPGFAIDGLAEPIENTPDEVRAHVHARFFLTGVNAVMQLNSVDFFQGHGENMAIAESDDLDANAPSRGGKNLAEIAHGGGGTP